MRFRETAIPGAWVLEPERHADERGFFARTWCRDEFARRGLNAALAQCSVSHNARRHTLRGMHYQCAPREEAKVVACHRGAVYDVVLDLRPRSPTYKRWTSVELSGESLLAVYVPEGCAHGFQTLTDDALVVYQIAESHAPECARGVRWDDPAFGIAWPAADARVISARDRAYPDFAG